MNSSRISLTHNNKQKIVLDILNLNTVALQISKETLFEAGKSNLIENNASETICRADL